MKSGFTNDPDVALTGLVSVALLGVIVICGGIVVGGVLERSLIQISAGVLLLAYLSWMVWQARHVVRCSLEDVERKGISRT